MHSKMKLAIAILFSPSPVYEEVLDRKLLTTGLFIVGIVGLLAILASIPRGIVGGPLHYYIIGKENPITWIGLCMLYSVILKWILKLIGYDVDYAKVLTVLSWAHVPFIILQFVQGVPMWIAMHHSLSPSMLRIIDASRFLIHIWFVYIVARGMVTAFKMPIIRAVVTYLVTAMMLIIAFTITFTMSRATPFKDSLPGISNSIKMVIANDQTPWAVASVVGYILGTHFLSKSLEMSKQLRTKIMTISILVGLFGSGIYIWQVMKADYYGRFLAAHSAYGRDKLGRAVEILRGLENIEYKNAPIMLDIADLYYVDGKPKEAIGAYNRFMDIVKEVKYGEAENQYFSRAYTGIGASYDYLGDYDNAIKNFEKASKLWKDFRDPWIRKSITLNKQGRYEEAIKAGTHATRKLGSESDIIWVSLATAFLKSGDKKGGETAAAVVFGNNPNLAKRVSEDGWEGAVFKLTLKDLKPPIDSETTNTKELENINKPEKK
ncbi:MAG: YIP1 family protein [Armatimonadota bacterium]